MNRLRIILIAGVWSISPAWADFDSGVVLFEQGDLKGAIQEFTPAADEGDRRAQYMLGAILLTSAKNDASIGKAARWFEKAAAQGHVEAQVELARLYRLGMGVPQDSAKMLKWYTAAASEGHVGAQLLVADAYAYGDGVEPDLVKAYVWYTIAMEYWGELVRNAHEHVASQMTPAQIREAKSKISAQKEKGRK